MLVSVDEPQCMIQPSAPYLGGHHWAPGDAGGAVSILLDRGAGSWLRRLAGSAEKAAANVVLWMPPLPEEERQMGGENS